jgi:outer membrane receptor for ferrienterochelin and colicin
VSDAVAKLPGVSQLTTGVGISKPVIRGLYGNRVQVNTLGLRFDNQQWQDEHGLGVGTDGVDRVEVIKGPAALQYGSEAIGGVLNILEPPPLRSIRSHRTPGAVLQQHARAIRRLRAEQEQSRVVVACARRGRQPRRL